MDVLLWIGRLVGVVGVLVCALAAVVRVGGNYVFGGYQVGTLLLAGSAAMVAGCFVLLWVLTAHRVVALKSGAQ
ncbi:MAG: hypothetical protein M3R40_12920 [Pseudomonadota bacterium]|nr:hypothetical protein [Pseudomonadota bacterium]